MPLLSLPGSSFQCSEKGLFRKKDNFGLVGPQQNDPLSEIQDDDHCSDSVFAAKRRRHLFIRSSRRLLARSNQSSFPPIFRLPARAEVLQVQGDALWTQHCSEGFHKTNQGNHQGATPGRDSNLGLSGRLVDLGRVNRSLQGSNGPSPKNDHEIWFSDQLGQVPTQTSEDIHLAGASVVTRQGYTVPNEGVSFESDSLSEEFQDSLFVHPQGIREADGSSIVCFRSGSDSEDHTEGSEQGSCHQSTTSSEGPSGSYAEKSPSPFKTMGEQSVLEEVGTSRSSPDLGDNQYRCVIGGLGRTLGDQNCVRPLVSQSQDVPYKCVGVNGSVLNSQIPQTTKGITHSPLHRQPSCSRLYPEGRLPSKSSQSCSASNYKASIQTKLVSVPSSSSRGTECTGRLTFQTVPSGGRVVFRQSIISEYFKGASPTGNRPIRHAGEQQTPPVRDSIPRPGSSGEGRSLTELEYIRDDISLPSSEPSFEGFGPTPGVRGDSGSSGTILAEQPLVSTTTSTQQQAQAYLEPGFIPTSSRSSRLQQLLTGPKPTCVDFIQSLYQKRKYDVVAATRLAKRIRKGSLRQYQAAWGRWLNYIREVQPSKVTKRLMTSYFNFLFDVAGLQVSTIRSHKSALYTPLRLGFKINLKKKIFTDLLDAFAIERPAPAKRPVSWNLDVVLQNLLKRNILSDYFLLQKTVFLLAMAMGARISEVEALKRGDEHLLLREDSVVFSFGDFLSKNERPLSRREPVHIQSLPSNKKLCPVATLRQYLQRTSNITSGPLFVHSKTGVPLQTATLAKSLVKFIGELHPGSNPKSHDCRKVSSSLAFLGEWILMRFRISQAGLGIGYL